MTASQQQVLGDKLLEASYWVVSPWASPQRWPATGSPLIPFCILIHSVPLSLNWLVTLATLSWGS